VADVKVLLYRYTGFQRDIRMIQAGRGAYCHAVAASDAYFIGVRSRGGIPIVMHLNNPGRADGGANAILIARVLANGEKSHSTVLSFLVLGDGDDFMRF